MKPNANLIGHGSHALNLAAVPLPQVAAKASDLSPRKLKRAAASHRESDPIRLNPTESDP